MKSPIQYTKILGARIDLSQLQFVSELKPESADDPIAYNFSYRLEGGDLIKVDLQLKRTATKQMLDQWALLAESNPAIKKALENTCPYEEAECVVDWCRQEGQITLLYDEGETISRGEKRVRAEYKALLDAWAAWKEIEPEVYSIIRQKLG